MVNEDDKTLLIETSERAKSNTHQIEEIKDRIGKLEDKTEDIHRIATSIEVVCNDIGYIKQGQVDLTNKVDNLSEKVDSQIKEIKCDVDAKVGNVSSKVEQLKLEPLEEMKKDKHEFKIEAFKQGIGYLVALIGGAIITLIANGTLKV